MPNEIQNHETEPEKAWVQASVEVPVRTAIERMASDEDRSIAKMAGRLLTTHPQVKKLLEAEAAGAGA